MPAEFLRYSREEFLKKKLVFKYASLESALSMLKNNSLWLTNPLVWSDPYEKKFFNHRYIVRGKEGAFPLANQMFCTCMTHNATGEAPWKVYADSQLGIKFTFYRDKLLEAVESAAQRDSLELYIGNVEYLKTSEINKNIVDIPFNPDDVDFSNHSGYARLMLLKRTYFAYEREIRWLFITKYKRKKNSPGFELKLDIPLQEIIKTVTIDSRAMPHTFAMIKSALEETCGLAPIPDPAAGKSRSRIQQSSLYLNKDFSKLLEIPEV